MLITTTVGKRHENSIAVTLNPAGGPVNRRRAASVARSLASRGCRVTFVDSDILPDGAMTFYYAQEAK